MGRRHVSWNEDSARKDYQVPEPSAPTRSPVKKTTTYQVCTDRVVSPSSAHSTKLRSPHHITPRSVYAQESLQRIRRIVPTSCFQIPTSRFARRPERLQRPLPGFASFPFDLLQRSTPWNLENGFRTSQTCRSLPGIIRHRFAHQMTVSSLHYSTCHWIEAIAKECSPDY